MSIDSPIILKRRAPAAVNPVTAAYKGHVVIENAVAGECVISGAAGNTSAVRPLGVVVSAEDRLGGSLGICWSGAVDFTNGAAVLTKGTNTTLASDAAGTLVTSAVGAGVWTVGTWLPEGEITVAAGATATMLVNIVLD